MTHRVALSASRTDSPAVVELLNSCELIFTTNVALRDRLFELFGERRVRFIPCATPTMIDFVKRELCDFHDGEPVEFITFGDLMKLSDKHA